MSKSQQSFSVRQRWPMGAQHTEPTPLGSGMHDELPLQQRLASEHRCSGPEQVQAPPASHALLQHSAPHAADA
ncbi:MAG TPA: hypothetical protein VM753_19690 [Anaeromyxobacter sp.]|nr:hypothetical protein [Anaeromyxobacter sp.]